MLAEFLRPKPIAKAQSDKEDASSSPAFVFSPTAAYILREETSPNHFYYLPRRLRTDRLYVQASGKPLGTTNQNIPFGEYHAFTTLPSLPDSCLCRGERLRCFPSFGSSAHDESRFSATLRYRGLASRASATYSGTCQGLGDGPLR